MLAGAIFGFWTRYDRWPWQRNVVLPPTDNSATPTASTSVSPIIKEPRDYVMEDVAKRLGELSPEQPVLGGKWYTLRFWFIDGSYATFYVEYEDGHIMRKMLMTADTSQAPQKISYKVNAVFEPGESDWILKSGKDQTSSLPLILFEYDQKVGRWTQKN